MVFCRGELVQKAAGLQLPCLLAARLALLVQVGNTLSCDRARSAQALPAGTMTALLGISILQMRVESKKHSGRCLLA